MYAEDAKDEDKRNNLINGGENNNHDEVESFQNKRWCLYNFGNGI